MDGNREMRRAMNRSEKKSEQFRSDLKRGPRKTPKQAKGGRSSGTASSGGKATARSGPNRFSNIFIGISALAAFFLLILPRAFPYELTLTNIAFHLLAFLFFAYFLCLWLLRRQVKSGVTITLAVGGALAVGVEIARAVISQNMTPVAVGLLGLAMVGTVAGAYLSLWLERMRAQTESR